MTTAIKNEVVAKVPRNDGCDDEGVLTAEQIRKLPKNVVFGTLEVLDKPEPIRKRRSVRKNRS